MNVHLQNNTSFSCAHRADDGGGKNDHLGNTRVVYRIPECGSGGPKYEYEALIDYYPFGKELRSSVPLHEKYYTTHHERDLKTQLDYRGARFYDAETGRFWGVDAMASKYPSLSSFNYVANNPVIYVDPDGEDIVLSGQALEYHNKLYNPTKVRRGFLGLGKMKERRNRNQSPKYIALYDKLDQDHTILVRAGNPGASNSEGSLRPQGYDALGRLVMDVIYSFPEDSHGGNDLHILLEELFHAGQVVDQGAMTEGKRNFVEATIHNEIEAKDFAFQVGLGPVNYTFESQGYILPTQMGIFRESSFNDKVKYLKEGLSVPARLIGTSRSDQSPVNIEYPLKPMYPNIPIK